MSDTVLDLRPKTNSKDKVAKEPQFAVGMLNDDYTTTEFVTGTLKEVFGRHGMTHEQALSHTQRIHTQGGTIVREIPLTEKVATEYADLIMDKARKQGHPFLAYPEPLY